MKRYCFYILISFLSFVLLSCQKQNTDVESFDTALTHLFQEELSSDPLSLHYSLAEAADYGLSESVSSAKLPLYSNEVLSAYYASIADTRVVLNSFPQFSLTDSQKGLQEKLLWYYDLEAEGAQFQDLMSPLYTISGLPTQLPLLLAEFRLADKTDIELYFSFLDSVYYCFESICSFTLEQQNKGIFLPNEAIGVLVEQIDTILAMTEENSPFLVSFQERLNSIEFLTEAEYATFIALNRYQIETSVIPGYALLYELLTQTRPPESMEPASLPASQNSFGPGSSSYRAYYSWLAKKQSSSSLSVPQMKALLLDAANTQLSIISRLQSEYPALLEEYETFSYPCSQTSDLITSAIDTAAYLQTAIANDFPPLPKTSHTASDRFVLSVKNVPRSLEQLLSPACYMLPPIDSYLHNTIYINPAYQNTDLFPTMAHEAFPGHLYAQVYFLSQNPPPIESIVDFIGWSEGWAVYAEHYSFALAGFSKPLADLLTASSLSMLYLYGLTDIGIHYDSWNLEDTCSFWAQFGCSRKQCEQMYPSIIGEPGQYLPYAVGGLLMTSLQEKVKAQAQETFEIKEFHRSVLSLGPMPYDLLYSYLLNDTRTLPTHFEVPQQDLFALPSSTE